MRDWLPGLDEVLPGSTAICVRDLGRSIAFCKGILGMTLTARLVFPETHGKAAYLLEGEGLDHLALRVERLDEAVAFIASKGHPKVLGPIESEAARWAYVLDPDWTWVEV